MAASSAFRPSMGRALRSCRTSATPSTGTTPSFLSLRLQPQNAASLSTSAALLRRHKYEGARDNRDNSKHRGESSLRRTGTKWKLSVSDEPLPKPVPREELPRPETDPDHGLWDFFQDRTTVANPPGKDRQHGRAWTVEELRRKSWDDLHRLWWVCVKERNKLATANLERRTSKLGFGDSEAQARDKEVRLTMRAIKHALTERFYTWEDAVEVAQNDPEVNLSGKGAAYTPQDYLEEDIEHNEQAPRELLDDAEGGGKLSGDAARAGRAAEAAKMLSGDETTPASKPHQDGFKV